MGTDSLYVVDLGKVDRSLKGEALEHACWDARTSLPGLPRDSRGVLEHPLDYHACWDGVFEHGPDAIRFDTILFKDDDGNPPAEPLLGLLELHHLDRMIASVEANAARIRIGNATGQLRALRAIRDACASNPNLRAAYAGDY